MEKKATNEIILKEGELENLLRRLVQEAKKEQISMSAFVDAVGAVWKETEDSKIEKFEFTVSEKLFSDKVRNFIEYYKLELLRFYNEQYNEIPHLVKEDRILTKYYQIICAMFMALERDGKVSMKTINKFTGKKFVWLSNTCNRGDIKLLKEFLCKLKFNGKIPEVGQKVTGQIYRMAEIKELKEKYDVLYNVNMETALAVIWLIKKYF